MLDEENAVKQKVSMASISDLKQACSRVELVLAACQVFGVKSIPTFSVRLRICSTLFFRGNTTFIPEEEWIIMNVWTESKGYKSLFAY
jgi:hypothetical protein